MKLFCSAFFCVCMMLLWGCNNEGAADKDGKMEVVAPTKPDALAPGRQIFEEKCVACHGSDGTAGVLGAANLQTITADSAIMIQTITNGKRSMPPFGKTLSADEILQVAQFAKSLNK